MTRLKKVLAALIAVVFAALSCLPGVLVLAENAQANTLSILSQTAEETPRYIHNVDEDKIIAFLDIETDVPGLRIETLSMTWIYTTAGLSLYSRGHCIFLRQSLGIPRPTDFSTSLTSRSYADMN